MHNSGADGTRRENLSRYLKIVPADEHHGCQLQEHGDFGRSPSFRQLFGQASARLYRINGRPGDKEQEEPPAFVLCHTFNSSISRVVQQVPPQRLNQSTPEIVFVWNRAVAFNHQDSEVCNKWPEDNHECASLQTGSIVCRALEAVDIECRSIRAEELSKRTKKL